MISKFKLRWVFLAVVTALSACSNGSGNGDSGTCLLSQFCDGTDSGNGISSSVASGNPVLTCPTSILAGKDVGGFKAKLVSANNSAVGLKNVFVSLKPIVGTDESGTITAFNADGTTNQGGGTTDANGELSFTVNAPVSGTKPYKLTVRAANDQNATPVFSNTCAVTVKPNPLRIVITGPKNEPTGAIQLAAGQAKSGFVARVVDSVGDPPPTDPAITLNFATSVAEDSTDNATKAGTISTPGTGLVADADGRVVFRYQAPPASAVKDLANIIFTATASGNGSTVNSGTYLIQVFPPAATVQPDPPKASVIAPSGQASGSASIVSGTTQDGFVFQLLNPDGTAIVGQTVTFSISSGTAKAAADTAGAVIVANPVNGQSNVGQTNGVGKVAFKVQAPVTGSSSAQPYTITASTIVNGTPVSTQFTIRVLSRGIPSLSLREGASAPSDTVVLAAGELHSDFVANLLDGQGEPLAANALTVTASDGKITFPSGQTTDTDGNLRFNYTAPTAVTDDEPILIRVSGSADGFQVPAAEYSLTVSPNTITITGPQAAPSDSLSIASAATQTGFRLRLTDGAGRPLSNKAVTVKPLTSGGGTAAADAGTVKLDRTTTDASGVITFQYTAPSIGQSDVPMIIRATTSLNNQTVTTDYNLTVTSLGLPKLAIGGPGNIASGRLNVAADDVASGFSVTFINGKGSPIANQPITLSLSPVVGSVIASEGSSTTTDSNGRILFDYFSPSTVSATTRVTITASGTSEGAKVNSTYVLNVTPPPAAAAPKLSLTGPTSVPSTQKATGYKATFVRTDGQAIQGEPVTFTATKGTISVVENGQERPGLATSTTDQFGQVSFVFKANSTSADTTGTISAALGSAASTAVQQQCNGASSGAVCNATLNVTVTADSFKFTSPAFGATANVEVKNALPLSFSWVDSKGVGVSGCIDLDATFQGSSNAPYGIVVGADPTPQTQIRRIQLDSSGNIQTALKVYSDRSGFVQITAKENRQCLDAGGSGTLTAVTGVQFQDVANTANNHVDLDAPLQVITSPDASGAQRRAKLTLTVLNDGYGALDGAQVLFTIASPAAPGDPNERVFPGGGTTDANGVATTEYYVPQITLATGESRTVSITGCLRGASNAGNNDGQVCSTRQIKIVPPTN